jgi:hypothetical protein
MPLVTKREAAPSATTVVVPAKSTAVTMKQDDDYIPFIIRNNPKVLELWENATEEERTAGLLLCEFQAKSTKSTIEHYFDFADKWNEVFPRSNKRLFKRGEDAIRKAAQLIGISHTTVYTALQTTRFYGRSGYEALAKKAAVNGVMLHWTHLRTIVTRLSDNKEARTKVEQILVQKQMTQNELEKLIDKYAPRPKKNEELSGPDTEQTAVRSLISMVSSFKNLAKSREKFVKTLENVDNEFAGDAEEGRIILEQTSALISSLEEIDEFVKEHSRYIQQIHDAVLAIVIGEDKAKKAEESAATIKKQIAHEKAEKRQKENARTAATAARGDFETSVADGDDDFSDFDDSDIDPSDNAAEMWDELGNMV